MSIPADLIRRAELLKNSSLKLFLDYDGTLIPIKMDPDDCYADSELKDILNSLDNNYEMYIVTGRSLDDITKFIGNAYNVIALHGAVMRIGGEIRENIPDLAYFTQICDRIFKNRKLFESQYDGLRMYNKNGNLLFHLGLMTDDRRKDELEGLVRNMGEENMMDVYEGKMIMELRVPGINKGSAILKMRNGSNAIIAGDDRTDEESFEANGDAVRIKVGIGKTKADFVLSDYREMRQFLKLL